MENPIDWTLFKKRIIIYKPITEVYAAWAKSQNLEKWFLEKAKFTDSMGTARKGEDLVKKGDHFVWKWNNWNFEEKGEILEANGINKISFTFGSGGNVHLELLAVNEATEVRLTQDSIPTDEKSKKDFYVGCATGWTFWLTNLKAWMEYRITLHATGLSQEATKDLVNS